MKIYNSVEEFSPDFKVVLTLGTFDGVHVGHKKILNRIISIAKEINGESVLLTFEPHPRKVLLNEIHQQKPKYNLGIYFKLKKALKDL